MNTKEYYISKLDLKPHIEGGYFKETLLGDEVNGRNLYSSILFLISKGEVSHFHRLKEDEVWYFHDGNSMVIYIIDENGNLEEVHLGRNIENGEVLQYAVKKNSIFASTMKNDGFSLVGCMVAPAFTYDHFELFYEDELTKMYPQYSYLYDELALKR